jgi:mercuric ion transport protein
MSTNLTSDVAAPAVEDAETGEAAPDHRAVERRGRRWLLWSFLACPCHLPWTLALLGTVLGGTALGAALRDHPVIAGVVIAATWAAGTARGLLLVRRAERGELVCAIKT